MQTLTRISPVVFSLVILMQPLTVWAQEADLDGLIVHAEKKIQARAFDEAETMLAQALQIAKIQLGEVSVPYGKVCHHYGLLHHAKGAYAKAEEWALRAKSVYEQAGLQRSVPYARVLQQLGTVNYHWGNNYDKAEAYFLNAVSLYNTTIGLESSEYCNAVFSLGHLYLYTGNYAQAEKCYREALELQEKLNGSNSIEYGTVLRAIGLLCGKKDQFDLAEVHFRTNATIIENKLGKNNAAYAAAIMNWAWPLFKLGQFETSENLLLESKSIFESLPDYERIPSYMSLMEFFGMYYQLIRQYEASEYYHLRSKSLRAASLGKDHLSCEMSLTYLSDLYRETAQIEKAAAAFAEGSALRRNHLSDASRHFSEKEVYAFTALFEATLHKHFSFARDYATQVPYFAGTCFDNILFYKGFLLGASNQFRNANITDPGFGVKFEGWKKLQKQLSDQYALSLSDRNNSSIAQLEDQINALEKDLTRVVAGFSEAIRQVSWTDVREALRPGEAALEFVHYKYYHPQPTDSIFYAALLLTKDMDAPLFIPLFEQAQIEALLPPQSQNRSEYVSRLYNDRRLTKYLWMPIEPYLKGIKTIHYASSGLIHRINIEALPDGNGRIISDRYAMSLMVSTKQLTHRQEPAAAIGNNNDALLFGAIQYDLQSLPTDDAPPDSLSVQPRGLSFAEISPDQRDGEWMPLKYSEKEISEIAATLQKTGIKHRAYTGSDATEQVFKQAGDNSASSPRILHVSTHGYFFPDSRLTKNAESTAPAYKISEHPMIRSGIIMAGGNLAWKTGRAPNQREDGILTAFEISQLDLSETELVVLSACETGLGDIVGNEGVYGLQRAFRIAGVRNVLMSLWQVPDYHTQELMTLFYKKWLEEKLPLHQALTAAQKALRDKGYEPYHWAGWVLVE